MAEHHPVSPAASGRAEYIRANQLLGLSSAVSHWIAKAAEPLAAKQNDSERQLIMKATHIILNQTMACLLRESPQYWFALSDMSRLRAVATAERGGPADRRGGGVLEIECLAADPTVDTPLRDGAALLQMIVDWAATTGRNVTFPPASRDEAREYYARVASETATDIWKLDMTVAEL